jgi:hypothetical protein
MARGSSPPKKLSYSLMAICFVWTYVVIYQLYSMVRSDSLSGAFESRILVISGVFFILLLPFFVYVVVLAIYKFYRKEPRA